MAEQKTLSGKKATYKLLYKEGKSMQISNVPGIPPIDVYIEILITDEQFEILDIMCDIQYDGTGQKWYKVNAQEFKIIPILEG